MKLLISCVHSDVSFLGYDWESDAVFWSAPAVALPTCGACYFNDEILVAADDTISMLDGRERSSLRFKGQCASLLHSVHQISADTFGVVDTGHSCLRVVSRDFQRVETLSPLTGWGIPPHDAIHLNDFAATLQGIFATCFDYRPWRHAGEHLPRQYWDHAGFGLILRLTDSDDRPLGNVAACGLNHPHSIHYHDSHLYVCSSATGHFHQYRLESDGSLTPASTRRVCQTHFLRGALRAGSAWYFGGSTARRGEENQEMTIYQVQDESPAVETRSLGMEGEIYDILPWREEVLAPIVAQHFGNRGWRDSRAPPGKHGQVESRSSPFSRKGKFAQHG